MITTRQKMTRYGGSLAVVLGVHAAAIAVALNWPAPEPIQLPPEAMMVEMAPLPEPAPPPPPQVVTPPAPPEPVIEDPLPKLAEAPKPTISVPKPKPPKPKPKPTPPKVEKKPEPPKEQPPAEQTVDTPPSAAPPVKSQAPAPSPPSNSNALPSWQVELLSHLAKYKKYPEDARRRGMQGINKLRFVVDADGKVLSYTLAAGSGSAALDRATMEMIRRAQPLPKPPAELLNNGSLEVVAPFVYSLDKR